MKFEKDSDENTKTNIPLHKMKEKMDTAEFLFVRPLKKLTSTLKKKAHEETLRQSNGQI